MEYYNQASITPSELPNTYLITLNLKEESTVIFEDGNTKSGFYTVIVQVKILNKLIK